MANALIATPTLSDAATLTADSEEATLPATNVQTFQPEKVWRTAGLTNMRLIFDFGSAVTINTAFAMFTNLTSAATMKIRGATTEANLAAAPGYDSGTITALDSGIPSDWDRPSAFKHIGTDPSYRWWDWQFWDAANPDGYIEVGKVVLDDPWIFAYNLDFDHPMGWEESSLQHRAQGGRSSVTDRQGSQRRKIDFTLKGQSKADMYNNALEMDRVIGLRGGIIFSLDIEDTTYRHMETIYCQMKELTPVVHERLSMFDKRYSLREVR